MKSAERVRHCEAGVGGAQTGKQRGGNSGLPLGNDVKWLGVKRVREADKGEAPVCGATV